MLLIHFDGYILCMVNSLAYLVAKSATLDYVTNTRRDVPLAAVLQIEHLVL